MSITACVLEAGVGGKVKPVFVDGLDDYQKIVGGYIEAVTAEFGDGLYVTMFCNEEGLLKDLEMNWVASALFMREIRGNVVLVRASDDDGVLGGDDVFDLPSSFIKWLNDKHLPRVAETYNESIMLGLMIQFALQENLMTPDEFSDFMESLDKYSSGEEITDELNEEMTKFIHMIMLRVEESSLAEAGDKLADEIYEYFKQEKNNGK
ncbi:Protein of unknown function DUF3846 [uncultured Caudovirales phage]|uniref:DUF3846 domain-containing protein n=1 Tax=uncultured Caudovirales phage TaxID=2100421 RepID=A0A6J7XFG0_9CAUD|nr:Protein of unknown function DUF3846 [uncultured Caudovirales phage]CAB4184169.1 Protein of unknown function DUF3846 [uncultured Caudovirales phage]CAB4214550.1 Protein of unknown function DUF3846 [uncultured Caudovirales phage]CAB5228786.1 Protein of unknown function DUF3846 [uncultured Caudovirales phage]